ncbi:MAG: hypothetical protein ACXWWC_13570 [Chitinophagaceae bacterium]
MPIDFYADAIEIANKIKQANSQPDCEKIILDKIKKLILNRKNDVEIIFYLKRLSTWLENKIAANRLHGERTNFGHAAGFIDTLLKMRSRKSWMKVINM